MSDGIDRRKQSLYFPEPMMQALQHQARRLDRSMSWVVQRCVKLSLHELDKLPSINETPKG